MKHAYLILAHHEFDILQKLVTALDDERNDIYIHVDKKVQVLPAIVAVKSRLEVLAARVDIRWGHVSQIHGEYGLFEAAYCSGQVYDYYHLISGVHLPLFGQDYIHDFFAGLQGKQLFMPMHTSDFQADLKLNRYNFFTKTFAHKNKAVARISQLLWGRIHAVQRLIHIRRFKKQLTYGYASNWVSVTPQAVSYLLADKRAILNKYRYTFCADEFFIPTELLQSGHVWDIHYEKRMLLHEVDHANAKTYTRKDYDLIQASGCLFARKFSALHMDLVERITTNLTNRK